MRVSIILEVGELMSALIVGLLNKYLDGKISEEEAQAKMPEYLKLLESENKS